MISTSACKVRKGLVGVDQHVTLIASVLFLRYHALHTQLAAARAPTSLLGYLGGVISADY